MIINKSLILTFDKYIMLDDKPKVGINYLSLVFTRGKNLIPCFPCFFGALVDASIPTYHLNF